MKGKIHRYLVTLLVGLMLFTAGCATRTDSDQIRNPKDGNISQEDENNGKTEKLKAENEIPEDGIITIEQMDSIAGSDGTYGFHGKDDNSGITYTWTYVGKKIQNPIEQNLKVEFPSKDVEKVMELANHAAVGLGIKMAGGNLAAPAKLTINLTEKWDADTAILCKIVENKPEKMSDVAIDQSSKDGKDITTISFLVTEMGDTYYVVGGKTKAEQIDKDNQQANNSDRKNENADQTDQSEKSQNEGNDNQENLGAQTCTISIECSTILDNWDDLNTAKSSFVPSDGWILYESTVEYTPGDTVYDVLYRVCRDTGIHMEASYTPVYGSYYVEGINQLYEFDCGELSGWMYSVNGWFPNYGCSKYELSDGDTIEWRYTCDLGRDVGDQYMGG